MGWQCESEQEVHNWRAKQRYIALHAFTARKHQPE